MLMQERQLNDTDAFHMLRAEIGSTARIDGHEADLAAIGAEVETIEAASHFLPMERPVLVRAELRRAAGR